jgi:hypothetical protein
MKKDADYLTEYLMSSNAGVVGNAARYLDACAFYSGQISEAMFLETLNKTDNEILQERNDYRDLDKV